MSRFRFAVAAAADDAQLRARMAADWMQGRIAVSFRREPSFFAGCPLQGEQVQTIVCVDRTTRKLIGLGTRASSAAYVNGAPARVGYLADLRCDPEYRGGTLLARGYRFLRELHERDPLPLYTTVIYDGNEPALNALCGARAGLPEYRRFGRLRTPAIRLDRDRAPLACDGIAIMRAGPELLPTLIAFLNARHATRQFAPVVRPADLQGGRLSGLQAGDFLLAMRHDRIVGSIALWDQSAMRQTHVEQYGGLLGAVRPLFNLYAKLAGVRPLPSPGSRVPYLYLACFALEDDDLDVGRTLLRAAYRAARGGPWHYAILGLHEGDPLAALLGEYPAIDAAGHLFVVHYGDGADEFARLDGRVPYLEAGCL
ncbi:MAG: hypothetical protein EHM59_19705 [Betaproteobacteria bacterium]|nr:MAG: hypothetical protein EHM59_19705 [Betaproteobacteria bacterium]